jgi:hypothetical protein
MVLGLIGHVARTHPFKFGCVFSCAKTSFSDWLVQTYIERRERIDWKRNLTFASFGFVYLGGVQYALYVPIFGRMFPNAASYAGKSLGSKLADAAGSRSMVAQVVIDQFIHHPFLYFPAFYSIKEVVNGGLVADGLAKYQRNYKEDLVALWKLWVPSTILNFAFMPMHMRIPWVATTSLFWTCILSYMRGSEDVPAELVADVSEDVSGNQGRALSAMLVRCSAASPLPLPLPFPPASPLAHFFPPSPRCSCAAPWPLAPQDNNTTTPQHNSRVTQCIFYVVTVCSIWRLTASNGKI